MDQTNNNQICKKHTNSTLEFIQVKNVKQEMKKNLFYCSSCINEDLSFQGVDHILIRQIANEGDTHIIQKWPPINNQKIIEQLIQVTANTQSHSKVEESITNFFSILKNEISIHIDTCQKKMINLTKNQTFNGESIIKEYQSISQISEFRKLLLSGGQADLYAKEQSCTEFVISVEEKNDENTEKLQDLLTKSQKKQSVLNLELPNQIKQSILGFIDQINFFDNDRYQSNQNRNSQSSEQYNVSEKIMKLISNKSNFCSDEFLRETRIKLTQLNCLLQSLSFENQFQENKKPMLFEELTNEQFDMIDVHVKHLSQMKGNEGYQGEVKNSNQVRSLKSVLNIKTNFIESSFINNFEGYLIDTFPYLRNLNFENMISEDDKFKKMTTISQERIDAMLNSSQQINQPVQYAPIQVNGEAIDIMQIIQLEKGNYQKGQEYLIVNKSNNQIEVQNSKHGSYKNCVSNIILEKDKKYIFRFSIEMLKEQGIQFMIGLMKSEDIHNNLGFSNKLSCYLKQTANSNTINLVNTDFGIGHNINGKPLEMQTNTNEQIELRVCLQEQLLEVLDYPNYSFRYGIKNDLKQNLINFKDLRLYIGLCESNFKVILKSAFIVKSF